MPSTLLTADALNLLACPVCRGALALVAPEIAEAEIRCAQCGRRYPLVDGIPVLLADRALSD